MRSKSGYTWALLWITLVSLISYISYISLYPGLLWAQDGPADRMDKGKPGKAVMVVIDRISWDDFVDSELPVLKGLTVKGAVGVMTTNPAAVFGRTPENTYATIGAGAKIGGGPAGGTAYNAGETVNQDRAGEVFTRNFGISVEKDGIVHLGLAEVEKINQGLKYNYSVGAIGTLLHKGGLKTAVIGNADLPGHNKQTGMKRRQAVLIAMDGQGFVDYGDVSAAMTLPSPQSLGGIKTNYAAMLNRFIQIRDKADFIVIETGDTSRIDELETLAMDGVLEAARKKSLEEIDRFVGRLLNHINLEKDLLMIVTPGPTYQAMAQGRFLTPFIIAGDGIETGLVWSGTTKRNGLVANTDIASTITAYFGLTEGENLPDTVELSGQPVETRESADSIRQITKFYESTVFLHNARYPLVKGYINTELVVILLCIVAIVYKKAAARYLVPLLTAITAVPLVMLWVGTLPHSSLIVVIFEVIGLSAAVTFLAMVPWRKRPLDPFLITTGLTTAVIVADLFAGAPLAKSSPFSYDIISGARFYGLGNEYMGVLLGSTIAFACIFLDRQQVCTPALKAAVVLLFALVTFTIAAPCLGTNVGGTMAAVAGFGAVGWILYGGRLTGRSVSAVMVCIAIVLAGLIIFDLSRATEAQSHIGRTAALIKENGFSEISRIVSRKWEMNFKLIKNTTWSWFYFISLVVIMFIGRRVPDRTARFKERFPVFNRCLPGLILGSIFALLFNDSGMVAAATMITFAAAPFLTGLIAEERKWRLRT